MRSELGQQARDLEKLCRQRRRELERFAAKMRPLEDQINDLRRSIFALLAPPPDLVEVTPALPIRTLEARGDE